MREYPIEFPPAEPRIDLSIIIVSWNVRELCCVIASTRLRETAGDLRLQTNRGRWRLSRWQC